MSMWDLCCSCDPICKSQRVELIGIVTPNLLVSVQHWNRYHNRGASRTSSLSRSCHSGYTPSKNSVHVSKCDVVSCPAKKNVLHSSMISSTRRISSSRFPLCSVEKQASSITPRRSSPYPFPSEGQGEVSSERAWRGAYRTAPSRRRSAGRYAGGSRGRRRPWPPRPPPPSAAAPRRCNPAATRRGAGPAPPAPPTSSPPPAPATRTVPTTPTPSPPRPAASPPPTARSPWLQLELDNSLSQSIQTKLRAYAAYYQCQLLEHPLFVP